jgi:hypothetical protein
VVATDDGMAVDTTDGVAAGGDAVGDELGSEQAARAHATATTSRSVPRRMPLCWMTSSGCERRMSG